MELVMSTNLETLPTLRFEILEVARILRMSRATLYERIRAGELKAQRDGRRRYVTAVELHRYVNSRNQ
jgi:excisionase family DNA binding protein